MKKNIFFTMIIVIIVGINAKAQQVSGFIESQNRVDRQGVTPTINIYAEGPVKGKLGWSAFSLTNKYYSQAYAGPTYSPTKWITLSGNIGLERDKNPVRVAGSVWIGTGKWSALSIHEFGGSGYWTKNLAKYQASKTTAVGFYAQRFAGVGPYAEKKFGRVTLWGTYLRGSDKPTGFIAAKFSF